MQNTFFRVPRMSLSKYWRAWCLEQSNLAKLDFAPDISKQAPVVSLTTVPSRIQQLKPTIVSLLRQSKLPAHIELNLPKKSNEAKPWCIPDWLVNLQALKIYWVDQDYGPATKFIPTLERYQHQDQLIIVVDDDMVYPKNLISQLLEADQAVGGAKVFCANGHCITKNHVFFDHPSDKHILAGQRRVAIIEGCGGYAIRSRHLDVVALKNTDQAPNGALRMDDIWISGHLSLRGVEKWQIPVGLRRSLPSALRPVIVGPRAELSNQLLDYFASSWKAEEYAPVDTAC